MLLSRASCRFGTITPPLIRILAVVEEYARLHHLVVVILSGTDDPHSSLSGHAEGEAIDLKVTTLHDLTDKRAFLFAIMGRLGPQFIGNVEHAGKPNEHIHIGLKRGAKFHAPQVPAHAARFTERA
jgi:hypothetical protein